MNIDMGRIGSDNNYSLVIRDVNMSWQPQNLTQTCSNSMGAFPSLSTCQSSTFMFLQMITSLFGRPASRYLENSDDIYGTEQSSGFAEFNGYNQNSYGSEKQSQSNSEYDFIIIGAGTAGCVLANRLSEIYEWNVLLLEAGIEEPQVADVPGFAAALRRSSIDWEFRTQPQKANCRARREGRCTWPRGRVMGGTSTINYMIYLRGGPQDYDDWAALGNQGWSYDEIYPYFLKSEDNRNIDHVRKEYHERVSPEYHARNGEWTVEYFPYQDRNTLLALDAWRELGLDLYDQNMRRQIGASLLQHSNRGGVRLSTNMAFVEPIRRVRKNLRVLTSSYVTRILINPSTKTAYGVEYIRNGRLTQVMARKEVILSAGVINSPKILMLSGVGPKLHLKLLKIRVIKNLPGVGRNLHDHTTIDGLVLALTNYTATTVETEQQQKDINYYVETNEGPMSSTGPLQANSFVRTSYERDPNRPDIQYSLDSSDVGNFFADPILTDESNVLPIAYYNGISIRPVLLVPKSRGYLLLNYTDPVMGPPLIYPNTFTEPEDMLRMLEAVRIALKFGTTQVMQNIGAQIVTNELSGCDQFKFGTDEYFFCIMRLYTTTLYHPVGTCKMSPKEDPLAVVSPELKVHGINRLRVIDSSIMPITVRANTNTATLMIGEKGADMIKFDWHNGGPQHEQTDFVDPTPPLENKLWAMKEIFHKLINKIF